MRIIILLAFLCLPFLSEAQIYKSYDKAGNVVFSDTPSKSAKKIELNDPQTYKSDEQKKSSMLEKPQEKKVKKEISYKPYSTFEIAQPANEQTLRPSEKGLGIVTISLLIEPKLQGNDQVIYYLDGMKAIGPTTSTTVELSNINRGTHNLQVEIVRGTGKQTQVIKTSNAITIYMHRPIISRNDEIAAIQPFTPDKPIKPTNTFKPLKPAGPLQPLQPAKALKPTS